MSQVRPGSTIALGTADVRRHTVMRRECIYIERAMPEHIARALVGGLVLSLLPGHSRLCTAMC
jgi:hypothetical protein